MKPRLLVPLLPVFLLSLHLATCGQKQEELKQTSPAQSDIKEIRATIDQINKRGEEAILANDFDTQLSFFTDDIVIDPPLEPPIKGKAAVRERQAVGQREGMKYHSFSGTTEDLWVCGDKVYERGTWGMSFTTNTMNRPFAPYGTYFQIWTKDGTGTYRIQYLMYTLDMNPYETGR
jgi:ketosteroid isomerase-like protein